MKNKVASVPKILLMSTDSTSAYRNVSPLALFLQERGYRVSLACSLEEFSDAKSYSEELKASGLEVYPLQISREVSLSDPLDLFRLVTFLRKQRFHIVHTNNSKIGFLGRTAAKLAGVPIIVHTQHGFPFHIPGRFSPLLNWMGIWEEKIVSQFTDLVIAVSEAERLKGLKFGVVDHSKIITIDNGIDTTFFDPAKISIETKAEARARLGLDKSEPIVGTISRFVGFKNLGCVLKTAKIVLAERPRTKFLMIGDGALYPELRSQAAQLGISDSVVFTGFVKNLAEIRVLISIMDVFFLPTLWESFGLVFAESMAMQVPVLGSKIEPLNHVIEDSVTGYLGESNDAMYFAQMLFRLLDDQPLRHQMGINGRRRVQNYFEESRSLQAVEREYRRLIEQKQVPDLLLANARPAE